MEEILGLFQTKLVPVSAGTPEEVAFVETAHRVVGARSRAMLLGAPHLPAWSWALATNTQYMWEGSYRSPPAIERVPIG